MSDLQILLISIGVTLIVVVVLFNGVQEWRARRRMRPTLTDTGHDVLLQDTPGTRREPGLWQAGEATAPADEPADIDVVCEAVIDIGFAHPVPGHELAEALQPVTRAGSKPVRSFVEREVGGHRQHLRPDESYVAVQLAIVMANRSGALTAIEWSTLWSTAQALAERFDGQIEAPEQEAVLKQASELDARCAAMDALVGLILQLSDAQPIAVIDQAAAEVGFVSSRGQWVWVAENGMSRFALQIERQDNDRSHRVDLVLDVPNSLPDDQAFSRMVAVGRDLAKRLDAQVLDDQGRTFQDSSSTAIDQQISSLYDQLDQAGFVAGTDRAARVFS